ncbi:MAG: manganese efflux pump [Planctomycetaceae bacterium]|nr:manganese efflux pump [Planctomycetaceae bacterium]
MNWLNLVGISVGLAMDAFAVSLAVGLVLAKVTPRHAFRMAFHFGLFQFLMPILGWLLGRDTAAIVAAFDHWLVFGLLGFVGGKMLCEAGERREFDPAKDPTRGLSLVTLSIATSLDALAIGLSMAFIGVSVWFPSVLIGLVACALSAVGIVLGSRIGPRWGPWAERLGGAVLILIGLKILVSHLAAS